MRTLNEPRSAEFIERKKLIEQTTLKTLDQSWSELFLWCSTHRVQRERLAGLECMLNKERRLIEEYNRNKKKVA